MSGIPVDTLVEIDNSYDRFSSLPYFRPSEFTQQDDDPFELCSMQHKHSKPRQGIDLGLELGLALEKSIKLRSQSQHQDSPSLSAGTPVNSNQTDLGILINFDDSPDKKILPGQDKNTCEHQNVKDSVFTHTASNPFELAWDVIEQEALNLADHIQYDKEKTISPRKMVDLAMKLSPDSMLLSPRSDARDEEILIHSSPELEMKKTPRFTKASQQTRGRMSVGSSPGLSNRSYATPLRTRPSLAVNPSPLRRNIREPMTSPAKSAPQRATFKTPLLRSSSATAPNNYGPPPKAPLFPKTGAMKAVHQQQQQVPPPPAPMRVPPKQPVNAPAPPRRSLVPSAPTPSLTFQSKLRAPLSRSESDALNQLPTNKAPEFQRQGSVRLGTKRVSVSHPPSSAPGSSSSSSHSNRLAPLTRTKTKGRENVES
ncbi:pollen-specific leucine-rich repeat extensin-like protein 2 [Daphnia pulicaria]|uniref:pollen-specific leucine-rich repeat extensin-like protein 2 n=1 Tax=Daphnia pulicaria TaxID=35523 RepID=UPI001EEC461A|nr:pollen-specific leucine-rich repeat extensin-like protein 2 [Daphnia pulicaria]